MDFQLTDEQLQLKKSLREFAEREILPNVMKWDEANHFPLETIKEMGRMGVLGMIFPAEYGGAGLGYVEYVIAIEELSRVDGSVGITVAAHNSLCSTIFCGRVKSSAKYIPKLATGEWLTHGDLPDPAPALTQAAARMSAVRKAEGGWVLNGTKTLSPTAIMPMSPW
jgi:alkylation response protein AidB-like acyl-CoA dehydrogenase